MSKISKVYAELIHDSRGEETIQVTVECDGGYHGSSAVPSGASKSSFEAKTVEAKTAIHNVSNEIEPLLIGKEVDNQAEIDRSLIDLDGTANKGRLGANAILGVSLAVSRAAANCMGLPLYHYIAQLADRKSYNIPVPLMNLINGGKHASNNLDFQEFMIIPDKISGYHNQLSAGKLIFSTLGEKLRGEGILLPIGDEGGYAPNLDTNEMALELLQNAVKESGYEPWNEISLGIDVAASSLPATFELSVNRYVHIFDNFPVLSIEDPFAEEDWESWNKITNKIVTENTKDKTPLIVGDDLYSTNLERFKKGIEQKSSNAILVKLNQIGTVSETLKVVELAKDNGIVTIVSHRSGETLDDYIADFAVGVGSQFIKTGAPNDAHPERMSKYRRLLSIEKELLND